MFKKLKEKITEEVKAAPRNLFQPLVQQNPQVMTPQTTPNESFSSDHHNDNISDNSKSFDYPTTPEPSGFTSIDLRTPEVNRKSSLIFPVYESPSYLQSDLESASEVEGSLCSSQRLGHITKESLYSSYQQVHSKYQKYKGRYVEIAKAYKKLEAVMSESQDIMLRKNAELKEQCQLEQKAKAHLEEILRNDLEEKDHIITTLNTKINLLKDSEESIATVESGFDEIPKTKLEEEILIDLNEGRVSPKSSKNSQQRVSGKHGAEDVRVLNDKLKVAEQKLSEQEAHIHQLEETLHTLKQKDSTSHSKLLAMENELKQLREQTDAEKVTLAETKMNFHRELESKDILMADLRAQITLLNDEKSGLESQISNMEADGKEKANVSLKKLEAVALLKQELQKKLEYESSLEKSLEQKTGECLELKHKMEELERTLETLKTSNDEMIRNLESDLCTTPSVDQCVEQELNQLRQKMKELEERSEFELRELRSTHEKDIEDEKSKYNELIKRIENSLKSKESEIVRTLEEKDQTIYKLKNKLQTMYDKFHADKTKIETTLKRDAIELQEKLNVMNEENVKLKQVTKELENNVLKKNNNALELTEKMTLINDQVKELIETIQGKESLIVTLKETIERDESDRNILNTKQETYIQQLETDKVDLVDRLKKKEQELELMETKKAKTNEEYQILSQKFKKMETKELELNSSIEQLKSLKAENNEQELETKTKKVYYLEQQLDSVQAKLEQIENVMKEKTQQEKIMTEKELELSEKLKHLQVVIVTKNDENIKLCNELSEKDTKLKSIAKTLIHIYVELKVTKSLHKNICDMLNSMNQHKSKWEEMKSVLKSIKSNACENIAKLNEELLEKETQLSDLRKVIVQLKININELEKDKEYNESQQDELMKKIENYKNILNEKSHEFKTQKDLEQQYEANLENLELHNAKLLNELNVLKKDFDAKLNEENEKYQLMQKDLNNKCESEIKLIKELKYMKTVIQEHEDKVPKSVVKSMEENYNKKLNEFKLLVEKLKNDMEKCKSEIKFGVDEKQELVKLIDSKEKYIASLQDRKSETEKMYADVKKELSNLIIDNEKLSKERILLQENLSQVSNAISSMREDESSSKKVLEKIQTVTNENSDLRSQKEKLQQEIEEISTIHKQHLHETKEELTKYMANNVELSSNLKQEVEKLNVLSKEKSDLVAHQERLTKLIATLKLDIEAKILLQDQINSQVSELLDEVKKYKAVNTELSSKSNELLEKINVLTKEKGEISFEKEHFTKIVATLQDKLKENKTSLHENQSSQVDELQNELTKCKALNMELEKYCEKYNASIEKLASYLKIPVKHPSPSNPHKAELDINFVIDKFKTLQTQVKNKEKNETDFFMLTLEEELKKERLINKNLEKNLKIEKEKQLRATESNKLVENLSNINMNQVQTYCSQMKSEVKQLKSYSMEQLDNFIKEFITMKMNLIQGVIKFKHESNNLAKTDTNPSTEVLKNTLNDKHAKKIKQLVSDFKQELISKEEEIQFLESKQFDRRDAEELYISSELKRSIMNLEEENQSLGNSLEELQLQIKQMKTNHSEEVTKLNAQHNEELRQLEAKWKEWMRIKLDDSEEKFREETDALSQEWQVERKMISEVGVTPHENNEELQNRLEGDTDLHKDLTKLRLELTQVKEQHKEEVKDLRRLLKLGKPGEDSTSECEGDGDRETAKLGQCLELEYLRNVLFEYMMGKEPLILARVLAAIVKFDPEHTAKILHREEQKVSVLGQMKFT